MQVVNLHLGRPVGVALGLCSQACSLVLLCLRRLDDNRKPTEVLAGLGHRGYTHLLLLKFDVRDALRASRRRVLDDPNVNNLAALRKEPEQVTLVGFARHLRHKYRPHIAIKPLLVLCHRVRRKAVRNVLLKLVRLVITSLPTPTIPVIPAPIPRSRPGPILLAISRPRPRAVSAAALAVPIPVPIPVPVPAAVPITVAVTTLLLPGFV
mmetsp:Transcript_4285/g.10320  ORF Transcript_4285/g.10320 Transcript_4285/m.10320 type:complete len:209 (+) Transcript_4285:1322-1948(+)